MNRDRLQDIYRNTHLADKTDIETIRQMTMDYPYYNLPYVILSKYYHDTQHYKFEDMLRQAAMRVKDRQALYDYIHGRQSNEEKIPVEIAIERIEDDKTPQIQEQVTTSVNEFLSDFSDSSTETYQAESQISEVLTTENEEVVVSDIKDSASESISELNKIEVSGIESEISEPEILSVQETDQLAEQKPFEFILDTHSEAPSLDKIEIDHDIIGEEIETEFSFSKHFGEDIKSEVVELEQKSENDSEVLEELANPVEMVVDNTHLSAEVSEIVKEETNYFRDAQEPKPAEEHAPSSHMDFFAWLKAPKPEVNSQIEQNEVVTEIEEEPVNTVTSDSNEVNEEDEPEKVEGKPVFNLDLIDKFIQSNPQITRPKKEFFNPENMAKRSEVIDLEFVSETLANIYYEQGNYELALKAYEKLSLQNPSKQAYFADLIEKIRKERK